MRHRGILFAAGEAEGLIAVFVLEDDRISLEVGGEEWAGWHVSLISLAEIGVNEYQFNLNGDLVRFVPDSRLDFAYGAVPGLCKAQEAATKTFRARRKTKKASRSSSTGHYPKIAVTEPIVVAPATPAPAPTEFTPPANKPSRKGPVKAKPVAVSRMTPEPPVAETAPPPPAEPVVVAAAKADPFSNDVPAVGQPRPADPATPPKGELVIDLRTANGQPQDPTAPSKSPAAANGHHPAHATSRLQKWPSSARQGSPVTSRARA